MSESGFEIPGSAWAVSMALVNEFVRAWSGEVQEYDVTPQGVFIRLALPNDREFRMARTRARGKSIDRHLALSDAIVLDAQNQAVQARACLAHIQAHLFA